jgi:alginate O-acetyltransferase complex protein AlgI
MDTLAEILRRFTASEFYVSLPFWGAFAAVVLIYRLTPRVSALRDVVLLISSILMLLTLPRFDLIMLASTLTLCAVTYSCGKLLAAPERITDTTKRKLIAAAGITFCVLALAFFKYRFIQDFLLHRPKALTATDFIFLIGISYSAFKAISFLIEAYKGAFKDPQLLSFLNYMLFFPSFISGPINRYTHWLENTATVRTVPARADLIPGAERVVLGLFKKTVLTVIVFPYTLKNLGTPLNEMPLSMMLVGLYAFALYMYFDFSGYSDLAIGSARIMGFVLPENFNKPFLKANIQQLWANWHMSLTGWLTDYVYWPTARKLRETDFFRKNPILLSNIAISFTFVICGIWHGDTMVFILWGIYQGIGLSVLNVYQKWKRKVRHPVMRKYFTSGLSYALGVVLTFNFFAVGLLTFTVSSEEMRMLLGRLI